MIYLTMDDIGMVSSKELSRIDKLKKRMPAMKITLFTVPFWNFIKPLNEDSEFCKWFEKNKEWVEIAIHGYTHTGEIYNRPVECKRSYEEQKEMFSKSIQILKKFLPKKYGFKAPGNHYNEHTQKVLEDLKFSYFAVGNTIIPLKSKTFKQGQVKTSHINKPNSFSSWNFKNEFALINEEIRQLYPHEKEYWPKRVSEAIDWYKGPLIFNNLEKNFIKVLKEIVKPSDSVLEIGCGHGKWFSIIKEITPNYVGIDWCKEMIELAKERFPNADFRVDNIFDFESSEKFDIVFEIQCLYAFRLSPDGFFELCKPFAKKVYAFEPRTSYKIHE